jgi:prepilin-type N-terminal cleavage/methylation domain-containing protein
MSRATTTGFTFIEVLACLLVLGMGVAAAVGMVMYGVMIANRAQGRATGMATALTIAVDPKPLVPAGSTWQGVVTGDCEGYINGFYVKRHESQGEVIAPGFHSAEVSVDVFDSFQGRPVTSYTTRILRQDPP